MNLTIEIIVSKMDKQKNTFKEVEKAILIPIATLTPPDPACSTQTQILNQ